MRSLWIVVAGACAACSANAPPGPVAEPSALSLGERDQILAVPWLSKSESRALSDDAGVARGGDEHAPRVAWRFPEHPGWQQVALGGNAVAWAMYLNSVHNRIHKAFSEYLERVLANAPAADPRNDPHLVVVLYVAVDQAGAIANLQIAKSSGVPTFDSDAASAFAGSAPFAPPPTALRSPDGLAYFGWELLRDPVFACSTMNARPFAFAVAPAR